LPRTRAWQRVEAANVDAFAQDHAGAKKPDAGHNLSGYLGWAVVARHRGREHDETGGTDRYERVGSKAGHSLPPLPFEANDSADKQSRAEPK
jgi:hypothetical protein